jgi:uridine kinase
VLCPQYDFISHTRKPDQVPISPARVIIVEGILLFTVPELKELLDWKIFVDTDADVRLLRRIERDLKERGRDFDGVKTQYLETVKPMHEAFVAPSKQFADIIVPRGGENGVALNLLLSKLRNEIEKR